MKAKAMLNEVFFRLPEMAKQTVTAKEMKEIFYQTDGRILTHGHFRDIGYKKLCPGIYELFLKPDDEPICNQMGSNSGAIYRALKP